VAYGLLIGTKISDLMTLNGVMTVDPHYICGNSLFCVILFYQVVHAFKMMWDFFYCGCI